MSIKRCITIFIVLIVLICSFCFAANPSVQVNGEILDFTDSNGNKVEAQIINDRTMVPLRKIFEVLNCEVDWDGETQTVIATKGNQKITLQIGNEVAEVSDTDTSAQREVTLDSAPVIVEGRTLVPFRFIGESLGMEVAWDGANSTAIIIDYDSFAELIKAKNKTLYDLFTDKFGAGHELTFTKKYFDEADSSNDNSIIAKISTDYSTLSSEITFDGTSELVKEIKNEEWDNIKYNVIYSGDAILINTPNYVFSSMMGISKNSLEAIDVTKFGFTGSYNDSLGDTIKELFAVENSQIKLGTYNEMKKELNLFLDKFFSSGSKKIDMSFFEYSYIDFDRLFSLITNNQTLNSLVMLNKAVFRYSTNFQDILFDYPDITYEAVTNSNDITLKINMKNDYKEKYEYEIKISK